MCCIQVEGDGDGMWAEKSGLLPKSINIIRGVDGSLLSCISLNIIRGVDGSLLSCISLNIIRGVDGSLLSCISLHTVLRHVPM